MKRIVKYLSNINHPRNYKNIDSLNKVAKFIIQEFKKIGLQISIQRFKAHGREYKKLFYVVVYFVVKIFLISSKSTLFF